MDRLPPPRFVVTDYLFPTKEHHETCTMKEALTETGHSVWDAVPPPAYVELEENRRAMEAKGGRGKDAAVVFYDGVNGFRAREWVVAQNWDASSFGFVAWGSPHVDLANGAQSQEKHGRAADEKLFVFDTLREQFPHCVVMVTFCAHAIASPDDGWLLKFCNENSELSYVPRFSTGWARCEKHEVMALLHFPKYIERQWQMFSDTDGNLRFQSLVEQVKGSFLFLGEERAALSRLVVEHLA